MTHAYQIPHITLRERQVISTSNKIDLQHVHAYRSNAHANREQQPSFLTHRSGFRDSFAPRLNSGSIPPAPESFSLQQPSLMPAEPLPIIRRPRSLRDLDDSVAILLRLSVLLFLPLQNGLGGSSLVPFEALPIVRRPGGLGDFNDGVAVFLRLGVLLLLPLCEGFARGRFEAADDVEGVDGAGDVCLGRRSVFRLRNVYVKRRSTHLCLRHGQSLNRDAEEREGESRRKTHFSRVKNVGLMSD